MSCQRTLTISAIALVCSGIASAETVFKSVDAHGRITYSSSPPPDASEVVEKVPITPGPTATERQEASRRADELQDAVQRAENQRQKQSTKTQGAVSAAEKELRNAQTDLTEARMQSDDDWQTIARGGRVLKQSYLDRVKRAERRVEQAEKALRRARSGTR